MAFILGLAPNGVYPADDVTAVAVVYYRLPVASRWPAFLRSTFSPLPAGTGGISQPLARMKGDCRAQAPSRFLWHFPSLTASGR